ncbi:hypothetical protein BC567DRAFT_85330 [Phyllosticta citribraziliensis]
MCVWGGVGWMDDRPGSRSTRWLAVFASACIVVVLFMRALPAHVDGLRWVCDAGSSLPLCLLQSSSQMNSWESVHFFLPSLSPSLSLPPSSRQFHLRTVHLQHSRLRLRATPSMYVRYGTARRAGLPTVSGGEKAAAAAAATQQTCNSYM